MKYYMMPIAALTLVWQLNAGSVMADEANDNQTSLFNGSDLTGWHVDVPQLDEYQKEHGEAGTSAGEEHEAKPQGEAEHE